MFALLLMIAGCATKQPAPQDEPVQETATVETEHIPAPVAEEDIEEDIYEDELMDEPELIIVDESQDEYERSLGELDASEISAETFVDDKHEILSIIEDLEQIMRKKDFPAWTKYLSDESRSYWSDAKNLSTLSGKLPGGGKVRLNSLKDYFEKFFIPARKGRVIDEIRYVTHDLVKAVQYKDDEDITTYMFERSGDTWVLHLDTDDQ